jgi:hypothetical protein
LECRFCHHDRPGCGEACHADLEKDWDTPAGQQLVMEWGRLMRLESGIRMIISDVYEVV